MDTAAFDALAAARDLEAAGMDRDLAEVTALNMQKAGTAHVDQLATRADLDNHRNATSAELENHRNATSAELENHRLANKSDLETGLAGLRTELKTEISDLRADMLKVALGIVIANAAFVVANTGIVIAAVKFL